jgi:hypothetical protein
MVERALEHLRQLAPFRDHQIGIERYHEAKRACAGIPSALTHGELSFQQVGRRADGTLVVFDLATLGLRPRLDDLCTVVPALAAHTGTDEGELLATYLDELAARGTDDVPKPDVAAHELRRLRILGAFQSLPWLVRAHADPELGIEALERCVATLTLRIDGS